MITEWMDGRGGYCSDVPSDLMSNNELLVAENCQWRAGLKKRLGISKYQTTDWSGFTAVRGGGRYYINGAWYTVVALDDGSVVNFYYGTGTTFTAIDNTFDWTTGYDVQMDELSGYIVCVNGSNKPAVIYYSGGWTVENLETLDIRTRDDSDWYAGQWTDATSTFTDDTTDAQDAGADDFQIGSATNNDGCYIASIVPFTKVVFSSAEQAAGAPVTEYTYWNGTAWTSISPTTSPAWTDAAGDRTLEFDIPLSAGELAWEPYDGSDTGTENTYILRIRHTTAATGAFSCDSLTVYHTQYLTQIFEDERPSSIVVHNQHMYLGFDHVVNVSPPNTVTGWNAREAQWFEGGGKIMQLVSYLDQTIVLKEDALFSLIGTSYAWVSSRALAPHGAVSRRSAAHVGPYVFFVAKDGIYIWNGTDANKVSNHIRTDIESWTLTDAAGINYKNEYWVGFPTDSIVLTTDPDTVRKIPAGENIGESRVSFFKFTSYKASGWIYEYGSGDNGYLLALGNDGTDPCLARCDNGTNDWTDTVITMQMRTKYFSNSPHTVKRYIRLHIKLADVTAGGESHTLTLYSDDGDVSDSQTLTVDAGSGYYETYVSIPYTLDGRNLAVDLQHATLYGTRLMSLAFESKTRRF